MFCLETLLGFGRINGAGLLLSHSEGMSKKKKTTQFTFLKLWWKWMQRALRKWMQRALRK